VYVLGLGGRINYLASISFWISASISSVLDLFKKLLSYDSLEVSVLYFFHFFSLF
jgi:hypothetical protein